MSDNSTDEANGRAHRWPSYVTIWRWHFYAGLFCIPIVMVLSITGTIYLFRPQIEAWDTSRFNAMVGSGERLPLDQQIAAAVTSVPGSSFDSCELPDPEQPQTATIVKLRESGTAIRVYVDPSNAKVLGTIAEDDRFIRWIRRTHGELLLGKRGSYLVELTASWTIVMILTGLVLWWPRGNRWFAGVLYPRLMRTGKVFWKDLHSVIGVWSSGLILFLIVTGLPWATFWGDYLKSVRKVTGTAVVKQDWEGGHQQHGGSRHKSHDVVLSEINQVAATAETLTLAAPVMLQPPRDGTDHWTIASDAANRPLRETAIVNAKTGEIVRRSTFADRHWVDRLVGYGIAIHEGQSFGLPNLILAVMATSALMLLSVSGMVLWWRRRKHGLLGAPDSSRSKPIPDISWQRVVPSMIIVLGLVVYLPLFGASLLAVVVIERAFLSRIPRVAVWLGL